MTLELLSIGLTFPLLNLLIAVVSASPLPESVEGIMKILQGLVGIVAGFVMIYWLRNAPPPSPYPRPPIRRSIKLLMIAAAALVFLVSLASHFSPPTQR